MLHFQESGFCCFKGGPPTIQNLRKRFHLSLTEEASLCFVSVEVNFPYDPLLEKRKKAKASNFSSLKKSLTTNQSRPEKQQGSLMTAMNSSVLICSYVISNPNSAELNQKVVLVNSSVGFGLKKLQFRLSKLLKKSCW
ncbi:hypothetical protein Bca52824_032713 [Brassica carinata]|uniref:Uncharacterized protein n=1 Tax=Brassica carinata TaxID=52824 RepID=A0A8X7SDL9_BRACI|nr:hypothetical protein Bca52824_032713 [Brassica carinata]